MNTTKVLPWFVLGALALLAGFVLLPRFATAPQSEGMKTLEKPAAKTKKPARKAAAAKSDAPRPRLTPPPGPSAAEFFANLPPPSKNFDAEAVERCVARRPAAVPKGGLFEGREHVFGALSFKPVKGAAAKRRIRERILADHNT
jgi:hypothetical protein